MKRVLIFGTFDGLHRGHLSFLRQARRRGSWLIASVASDAYVREHKRREPMQLQGERIQRLLESKIVDEAHVSDENVGSYSIVARTKPDLICVGHDQDQLKEHIAEWMLVNGIRIPLKVMRAHRPERYKSSKILEGRNAP